MKAKEKLVVFGAGGHAKVVIDIIEQQGIYEITGLLDDDLKHQGKRFFGYPVLGTRGDTIPGWVIKASLPNVQLGWLAPQKSTT